MRTNDYSSVLSAVEITDQNANEITLSATNARDQIKAAAHTMLSLMSLDDDVTPSADMLAEAAWSVECLLKLQEELQQLMERAERARRPSQATLEAAASRIIEHSIAGRA